jgi:cytochrome d ubiquinol oxidase subunit II
VALGNVVRGLPLDSSGFFFEPLWTNFRLGADTGVLDWYTLLVGLAAYFALMQHGALWLALKTEGPVARRARRLAGICWWFVLSLTIVITYCSFVVQPHLAASFAKHPLGSVFPLLAVAGLAGVRWWLRWSDDRVAEWRAFLASCAFLVGMLTSAAFGLYPMMLPARGNAAYSLIIENAKAGEYGLRVGLVWWVIGMALVAGYFVYVYRSFAGKVLPGGGHDGDSHQGY